MALDSTFAALLNGTQEEQIEAIEELTRARLCVLCASATVPSELEYIVTEVTISRYNRIGSEGLSSHNVEGESMAWTDDDFSPYLSDIEKYKTATTDEHYGRIAFI